MDGILDKHSGRPLFAKSTLGSIGDDGSLSPQSAPVLCTEFGGLNIRPADESKAKEGDWGYITAQDSNDLLRRLELLCTGIVDGGFVSGFVYTQLYDDLYIFS
jgi:hypothetical protein